MSDFYAGYYNLFLFFVKRAGIYARMSEMTWTEAIIGRNISELFKLP
jgi:hypothetical protein